jgi:serine/threonine protein kinase
LDEDDLKENNDPSKGKDPKEIELSKK